MARQCELLGVSRSGTYYVPVPESAENLDVMRRIDKLYTARPFLGARKITDALRKQGHAINHKRVERLMRLMGFKAIYPGPRTSTPSPEHKIYPYLLRNLEITRPDQVWASDITYLPMRRGFLYLIAVMDWFSRCVLAWELSNTMDAQFCVDTLEKALARGVPEIFNTDQGAQFTSDDFTGPLKREGVQISMDGKGRALDNVFIERLWRSVKYEEVYLNEYIDGQHAHRRLLEYFDFYNEERPHQGLGYKTPKQVYETRQDTRLI
jgi:putative transposase